MTTVGIYARVSTEDKNQDPDTQLLPLTAYCERQEWEVFERYVDHASATDFGRRHRWNCMLLDASLKRFDIMLVYRLDRAFRSVLDGVNTLECLRGWQVGFRSLSEPYIDTTTPFGEAMFHISAAWAQLERGILGERVSAGMARAKAQGVHVGRPNMIDLVDVELVTSLRERGFSFRDIARRHPFVTLASGRHKRPSEGTIRRVIDMGHRQYQGVY